ncbi:tRNA (guanine37-N(1)-) methyltransferase [Tamilnaduibacter salinus]|uniref:tRNA (guanine-N(1)-)-methyltransferase n=1 Tax=Tamilnaduibacter salinus TaxID=1484056 RepID=A0A2A2I7D4_9GAMM|nr:tRNA (guanosine(37)-N1)-methyltransferase TrmD [Tamilnaduibacter salinus]PAV27204.1 tRNA (guanosine(37)-N1)-methyltransferase TrmD [Tamilnaduibacter salinus]PVY78960.1 tRNA (guanine37-N(1)-) methyltransferase [Tamilnaduibacter salinus]
MWIGAVSLFPDMFEAVTGYGVTGRAIREGLVRFQCWNPRDFTHDRHRTVDERPYGGGPGMLMKIQPLRDAIHAAREAAEGPAKVVYLSPQGRPLDQSAVDRLVTSERLILVSGRYEGVDERLIQSEVDEEISLGDFVLSGGELAAMAVMDAVIRRVPGALGHSQSAEEDSFAAGLLDCPHYTRPEVYEGQSVPPVLLGGNHEEIRRWRLKESLRRTLERRSDLLQKRFLTDEESVLLDQVTGERGGDTGSSKH